MPPIRTKRSKKPDKALGICEANTDFEFTFTLISGDEKVLKVHGYHLIAAS